MEYKKLDEVLWFQEGPGVRNYQYTKSGIKLINVTNLVGKKLDLSLTDKYLSINEVNSKYSHFLCKEGDLLVASSGITYDSIPNKVSFVSKSDLPLCMNTSVIRFESIDEAFNINYAYYFFKSNYYRDQILKLMTGIAQLNYGPSHLHKVKIPVYNFDKQQEIVSILDKINAIIDADKKQLDLLDETVKSRFIEMFKNKDYPKTQIRNVVDIKKISAKKTYEKDDKIRYIDISSIDNSTNQVIGYTPYVFKHAPSRAQQCLKNGDILVSTVRPNLKNIAIFNGDSTDCVGSSGFCVLRASKCSTQYLKYIVLDDEFTEAMVKLTTGASYPAIRDDDVLDYEMIDAPIELQNKFADFVQQIDKSKFNIQQHLNLMQELLDKKMEEFFGGE